MSDRQRHVPLHVRTQRRFPPAHVVSQRKKNYLSHRFQMMAEYITTMIIIVILLVGVPLVIITSFYFPPLGKWMENIVSFLSPMGVVCFAIIILMPIGHSVIRSLARFQENLEHIAFYLLYRFCTYVDPGGLMRSRLAQVRGFYPEKFAYEFRGKILVIRIKPSAPSQVASSAMALSSSSQENEDKRDQHTLIRVERVDEELVKGEYQVEEDVYASDEKQENILIIDEEYKEVKEENKNIKIKYAVSIHKDIVLSIICYKDDSDGKEVITSKKEIYFSNLYQKAVIAYIAIFGKDRGVKGNIIIKNIYGNTYDKEEKGKKQSSFNNDVRRIRQKIESNIEEPLPPEHDIFKLQKETGWSLSLNCHVRGLMGSIDQYYQLLAEKLSSSSSPTYRIEQLQKIAQQLIRYYSNSYLKKNTDEEAYGGGVLWECLKEEGFSLWASEVFQEYRRKYIAILTYIAERECQFVQGLDETEEWLENAALLYKECAYAATCNPVDTQLGEKLLVSCIQLYMEIEEEDKAENMYSVYKRRMQKVWGNWDLMPKTREKLDEWGLLDE